MGDFEFDDDDIFGAASDSSDSGTSFEGFGDDSDDLFGASSSSSGSTSSSDSASSSDGSNDKENSGGKLAKLRNADDKMKRKLISLAFIIIGIVSLVIIFTIIGNKSKNKYSSSEADVSQASNGGDVTTSAPVQQQPTSSQTNATNSSRTSDDWIRVSDLNISYSSEIPSSMRITDIEYYAKKTNSTRHQLELKATITGAIDGLDGMYSLDVPLYVLETVGASNKKVQVGSSIAVWYRIAQSGDSSFVVDLHWEKNSD